MKLLLCLAIASTLAGRVLAQGSRLESDCAPGENSIKSDVTCVCGVLFENTLDVNTKDLKIDYCRSRKCGDVFNNCCSAEQIACLENGRAVVDLIFEDNYKAALATVENGDTRIIQYCENIKCPTDIEYKTTTCLTRCFGETTLKDVVEGLDAIATQAEYDAVLNECEEFEVDSPEEVECYLDAYTTINPGKFKIGGVPCVVSQPITECILDERLDVE